MAAVAALAGGATQVTAVDSSSAALEVAKENLAANAMDVSKISLEQADVFAYQRLLRDQGRSFGLVVLDPPKFAPTAAQGSTPRSRPRRTSCARWRRRRMAGWCCCPP